MEYNLLKTILPQVLNGMPATPYVRLTSTPSRDLINPGMGQISRLYSFYTPLPGLHNPYEINKLDKTNNHQEGFGDINQTDDKTDNVHIDNNPPLIENENSLSETLPETTETNDGLVESFQHPTIKVKKVIFNSENKLKDKTSKKTLQRKELKQPLKQTIKKHKFNVI